MKNLLLSLFALFLFSFHLSAQCPQDTVPPVLVLVAPLTISIPPINGTTCLFPSDFIDTVYDNCTAAGQIQFGVRTPDSIGCAFISGNFICFQCCAMDVYPNIVEVWAKDEAGNETRLQTTVTITDGGGCDLYGGTIFVSAHTENWHYIDTFHVRLEITAPTGQPYVYNFNAKKGFVNFDAITATTPYIVTPGKNTKVTNGISTFDLLLISKHILGVAPLSSPYKMIAADANHSNSITTFDIVSLRKLLLGITDTIAGNQSWRFVDRNFQFPNAQNAFQTAFPETISYPYIIDDIQKSEFIGIKIGDVNNSADTSASQSEPEPRAYSELTIGDQTLQSGAFTDIEIKTPNALQINGLQLELHYDPSALAIESLTSDLLPDFSAENYHVLRPGVLRIVWEDAQARALVPESTLFNIRAKCLTNTNLNTSLFIDETEFDAELIHNETQNDRPVLHFRNKTAGKSTALANVFPNPANNNLYLQLNAATSAAVQFNIYDLNGRQITTPQLNIPTETTLIAIPGIENLSAGTYFWRLSSPELNESGYFAKN